MLRYQRWRRRGFRDPVSSPQGPRVPLPAAALWHNETAEDVFQEVWGKIIKARSSYRPDGEIHDVSLPGRTQLLYRSRAAQQTACWKYAAGPRAARRSRRNAETTTERSLARERLEIALTELPDEQRDAFLLREEGGLSVDQIATVMGCNRETAKSRLRYAVNKLRTAIDEPAETQ